MGERLIHGDKMNGRADGKTNVHLVLAIIVSVFSLMLIVVTCTLSWEMWMIPLIILGLLLVWGLRIVPLVGEDAYEYLCSGIILFVLFFYGVHETSLFDLPITMGVFIVTLSMLDKKILLCLSVLTYLLVLLYHGIFLHTISLTMSPLEFSRLVLDVIAMFSETLLVGYMIGRRKKKNEDVRELTEQLETAKQQNADFLSNMSHELRTPINVVTGISGVLLGQEFSKEQREDIQSVQIAGIRLAEQMKDILDYTEIVENALVVLEERYMMSSILADLIAVQKKEKELELVFDMDVNLPAVLIGDGEKIFHILKHITDNAMKYTKEGGVYVHIGFRKENYGINLSMDISDTGIGMSSSQLARVCDDFYQADSGYNRKNGGLGLGLSITKGLLRAIGGFMHIQSREGQGTQVHISIPQQVADDRPGMQVDNPEKFCIAYYLKADKYERREVGSYYSRMIRHMMTGLGIEGHRVHHLEELEKLLLNGRLTHLFIGKEEYEEKTDYFDKLAETVCVILVAGDGMTLPKGSRIHLFRKPFHPMSVLNLLNGAAPVKGAMGTVVCEGRFVCVGVRALVVDDEEMNLVVARGVLGGYGMQVETCLGGEEAVERCAGTAYDIVFLDHMMPGIDGVETLKRIRLTGGGAYQTTPIIALTANAVSGAREMFRNEGFTEFVPKPIERPVLERVLRHVLPEQCIRYESECGEGQPKEVQTGEPKEVQTGEPKEVQPGKLEESAGEQTFLEYLDNCGVHTELGLQYCGGSDAFYAQMLTMFCDQSADKRKEIIDLYDAGEWKEYAVKVHALKSTSKMIGAEELSELARKMEQAGKSDDRALIREHQSEMLDLYEKVCAMISDSLVRNTMRKGEE